MAFDRYMAVCHSQVTWVRSLQLLYNYATVIIRYILLYQIIITDKLLLIRKQYKEVFKCDTKNILVLYSFLH